MTHTSLNGLMGGKIYVPMEENNQFLQDLSNFLQNETEMDQIFDLCERINVEFNFFLDLDFKDEELIPDPGEIRRFIRRIVLKLLPEANKSLFCAAMRKNSPNQHLYFGFTVTVESARYLRDQICRGLESRYPLISKSSRNWNNIVDGTFNGLRMIGSQKQNKDRTCLFRTNDFYLFLDEQKNQLILPNYEQLKKTSLFSKQSYSFLIKKPKIMMALDVMGYTDEAEPINQNEVLSFLQNHTKFFDKI